jgi:two-component system chemotaxis sensor kinase CheA
MEGLHESILVVDDQIELAETLQQGLQIEGYKVITATSVDEAVSKLRSHSVFLVLTDYKMPVKTGVDLAVFCKENYPLLAVIFMTGLGEKQIVIEAMRAGVRDFIDKPFKLSDVVSRIKIVAVGRIEELEREKRELEDLKNIFVEEAKSILVDLDPLLTNLDEAVTPEELNLIYRKVHTLKGSAGSLPNSAHLVRLAHSFETCLSGLKDRKISITPEMLTVMLSSLEILGQCVSAIAHNDDLPDTSNLRSTLDILSQTSSSSSPTTGQAVMGPSGSNVSKTAATEPRKTDTSEDGVVVHNDRLELLKDLAGELVAFKNTFDVFLKQHGEEMGGNLRELMEMARTLFKITDSLQAEVSNIQQVTFGKTFSKFPRIVKQVSGELRKQIKLNIVGSEMTVDRTVSRVLSDALMHAVRNSCDHGVEKPDIRTKAGKSAFGNINIKGAQSADTITVEVFDDGAGLNRDRILKKAIEMEMLTQDSASNLSDEEVWEMLFLPNFSTAEKVSDISGRGVGMDVVRTAAKKLGGNVWFSTIPGCETRLTMQFPVPKSLVVESSVVAVYGDHTLIVPLNSISEIRHVDENEMTFVQHYWTFQNRGSTVPAGSFRFIVDDESVSKGERYAASYKRSGLVAILQHRGRSVGVFLDQIVDQLEAVIRPFDEVIGRISGFRGVSRLPNDGVGYVLSAEDAILNVLESSK